MRAEESAASSTSKSLSPTCSLTVNLKNKKDYPMLFGMGYVSVKILKILIDDIQYNS